MFEFKEETITEYRSIMREEIKIHEKWHADNKLLSNAETVLNLTIQILEVTYSSTVLRRYNHTYGLTDDKRAFESVGAHINLMKEILDRALCFIYGPYGDARHEGYPREDIMRAAGRLDLPKITTENSAKNNKDEEKMLKIEHKYLTEFGKHSPKNMITTEYNIARIIDEAENASSPLGRILYLTREVSRFFAALVEESLKNPPLVSINSLLTTKEDRESIRIAKKNCKNANVCTASEKLIVDYFKTEDLAKYDETGFFTAIIVFATLVVRHEWPTWREEDYQDSKNTILV